MKETELLALYCDKLSARAAQVALSAETGSLMVLFREPAVLEPKDLHRCRCYKLKAAGFSCSAVFLFC